MGHIKSKKIKPLKITPPTKPVHPWRVCPYGEHQVVTHPLHVPPSKKNPDGVTTRHWHCAKNPSRKDQLYPGEIEEIANQNFSKLKNKPCPLPLKFGGNGSNFDDFIAGWTQYWNDIFKPSEPLDPNFVKALIASESSFNPKKIADPQNSNSARGLTQITNKTRKILDNRKGELKDHYITVTKEELNDPNTNICAGIRWLFQKKDLTTSKLGHEASWLETIYNYKGASKAPPERAEEIMRRFNGYYEDYKKCGKK
ncbi:MAG: transglycosylase SLT domain-containing protein [Deltaproteobacteria bacterium]|nr:transglycosylase SLT domain-containing protein [Deltaproteobacteria bacterium]